MQEAGLFQIEVRPGAIGEIMRALNDLIFR